MKTTNAIPIAHRLTQLVFIILVLAVTYGVFAGAVVTMYYDVVPDMGSIEDRLGSPLLVLYLIAILLSLSRLPWALWEFKNKMWKRGLIQSILSIGPLFIFMGSDGLVSHLLWWHRISETDRFHILHHSLFGGVPLTALYGLVVRRSWKMGKATELLITTAFLAISVVFVAVFCLALGLLMGSLGVALALLVGLLIVMAWVMRAEKQMT